LEHACFTISPKCWPNRKDAMKQKFLFVVVVISFLLPAMVSGQNDVVPIATEFLLGGIVNGEWVEPELVQASVPAGLNYRRFNFNEELPSVVGSGSYLGNGGCEFYCISFADSDIDSDETLKVGSRAASIPRPG